MPFSPVKPVLRCDALRSNENKEKALRACRKASGRRSQLRSRLRTARRSCQLVLQQAALWFAPCREAAKGSLLPLQASLHRALQPAASSAVSATAKLELRGWRAMQLAAQPQLAAQLAARELPRNSGGEALQILPAAKGSASKILRSSPTDY